ncbi:CHY zinc finger protein [Streptococcus dentiloxodontae]
MAVAIYGLLVDRQSRCQHYQTDLDIVALKCFGCQRYYACYLCHDTLENHSYQAYPSSYSRDKAVVCGVCYYEMTIEHYQKSKACPNCQSRFNPNCAKHRNIYFISK